MVQESPCSCLLSILNLKSTVLTASTWGSSVLSTLARSDVEELAEGCAGDTVKKPEVHWIHKTSSWVRADYSTRIYEYIYMNMYI